MAAGNPGKSYGVGPSAEKMNVGPATGMNSKLDATGKVYEGGTLVFDPAVDGVQVRQADPTIDYAKGVGIPEEDGE